MRTRSVTLIFGLLASLLIVPVAASAQDSAEICDADALTAAVEGGDAEGTIEGMSDDPVGTAASNNPVLTTLTQAATEAGLVDALNSAVDLTIFAPTDCAFAAVDPAMMDAVMADPAGMLTTVLGYHVIAGERLTQEDLSGDYETFAGETITVNGADVDGQATIVVPNVETANATVHLIDTVMMPPSAMELAQVDPTEAMTEMEATEAMTEMEAMTPTPTPVAQPAGDSSAAPSGGVGTGGGGTAGNSLPIPLMIVGLLSIVALGAALVARRSA